MPKRLANTATAWAVPWTIAFGGSAPPKPLQAEDESKHPTKTMPMLPPL
jgi:hypothetical protein